MPHDEKDGVVKTGDAGAIGDATVDDEAFGKALSKAGFEPAKVGRKVVPQGRRTESLKKPSAKNLG